MADETSQEPSGICEITVEGFKSLRDRWTCEIRPLTILAGANSSGKSSLMQPLLLMKQTLNSPTDPGPLLLYGANAKLRGMREALHHRPGPSYNESLAVGIRRLGGSGFDVRYCASDDDTAAIIDCVTYAYVGSVRLWPGMTVGDLNAELHFTHVELPEASRVLVWDGAPEQFAVTRNSCFLSATMRMREKETDLPAIIQIRPDPPSVDAVRSVIHVPGLRSPRDVVWPRPHAGSGFPGTFDDYLGSILVEWQLRSSDQLAHLNRQLQEPQLATGVRARALDATQVLVEVSPASAPSSSGAADFVNVSHVGFGVSQVLPVLVALLAAEPGQLVYLEQPELHLHPRAQVALAGPLVEAANRGVRVVAETHSDLLLLAIQTAVAKGEIAPDKVMLHWFERDEQTGVSKVTPSGVDETGAFDKDWPEDFGNVRIQAERALLATTWA